jgi:hypothetical protein
MQHWIDLSVEEDRGNWMCSHRPNSAEAASTSAFIMVETFDLNRKMTLKK